MPGIEEQRRVYYDFELDIEAYNLKGIVQKFPNHFHDYYVIGFVEGGKRHLWCKGREYDVAAGDLILFNPRDNHYCAPLNSENLDYRAVNIKTEVMEQAVWEITGKKYMPHFDYTVVYQSDIAPSVGTLYQSIKTSAPRMEREENLFFLLEQVLGEYTTPFDEMNLCDPNPQIQRLCEYMESHFEQNITLDELVSMTSFGKSYLLRMFTKETGVSPYRYLQTVRLKEAKRLLETGEPPVEVAGMTGFADQSHFTNFFKEFIGLTPKQYQRIFEHPVKPETLEQERQNGTAK